MDRLVTIDEVCRTTAMPKSSVYNRMQRGLFPKPLKVGPRSVRWLESELENWMASRPRTQEVASVG